MTAVPAASASAAPRKYDVKAGVVTFESVVTVAGVVTRSRIVVSFDDWGAKERRDTSRDGRLRETVLSDGRRRFKIDHERNVAWEDGDGARGTEPRLAWDEVPARDQAEGRARRLPPKTIAGRTCEVFEVRDRDGGFSRFAGVAGVVLHAEVTNDAMTAVTTAVAYEERPALPAETFELPPIYAGS